MYSQLESCVRCKEGLTDYFKCTIGTRQGCMLSPFLFSLFINELSTYLTDTQTAGIYVDENLPSISILMYADDVADVADLPIALQRKLNQLEKFCQQLEMEVNLSKSKIII